MMLVSSENPILLSLGAGDRVQTRVSSPVHPGMVRIVFTCPTFPLTSWQISFIFHFLDAN